ncbi:hypothetical protein [Pedobacter insulae]|uniref:YceI-like domain-containing protein n=1 Tax=Pedobacter insulae TaxID=414048 RepID=A0A1I3A310_9SPHI|nr:hypothetical protein [Pedobacter insulae]SFH43701.1 hypothetical protein SAMN04489864_11283 [Pedobacter insulae]
MKNFKKFAINRVGLISISSIGIGLFLLSTIEIGRQQAKFEVLSSKFTLSGSSSGNKWVLAANSVASTGEFEFRDQELLNISELTFTIPIQQLKCSNHQQESMLQEILIQNNCTKLAFKQEHVMILPIMKMAHVIGGFSMFNGAYNIPMQLHYELNEDRSLRIWGKQVVSLSAFGFKIPAYEVGKIDDEMELEIDFVLVNKREGRTNLFVWNRSL